MLNATAATMNMTSPVSAAILSTLNFTGTTTTAVPSLLTTVLFNATGSG